MASTVSKTGYQGFGSFHSDDVELLIRQNAESYVSPSLPFLEPAEETRHSCSKDSFGNAARNQFMIDFGQWTFVNHGAFGGVSQAAYACAEQWRRHCELQPLRFFDRELFPQLVRVIRELAAFVNCRPQDLVLLPNATTGLNAVINSVKLSPGDAVYSLNIGYGSVKKMLQAACDASEAHQVVGEVTFPISGPGDVISLVERTIPDGTKLAVFDAVTSNTALVLPIQELVSLCRKKQIPVLIDGAHALGILPINLQQLQADFFVSNCHKWLCGVHGSAMMYVAEQWQQQMQPPVLSHGAEAGFLSRFIWDGCRDYSPLLAISTAVRWWTGLGVCVCCSSTAADGTVDTAVGSPAVGGSTAAADDGGSAIGEAGGMRSCIPDKLQLSSSSSSAAAAAAAAGAPAAASQAAESASAVGPNGADAQSLPAAAAAAAATVRRGARSAASPAASGAETAASNGAAADLTPLPAAGAAALLADSHLAVVPAVLAHPAAAAAAATGDVQAALNPAALAHPGDGGSAARVFMYQLLRSAADMLVQRWGTCCLGPPSMTAAMALVQLPVGACVPGPGGATSADAKYIQDELHFQHKIEVPIKTIQDTLYVRISAHIYNTMQDYLKLAEAVEVLCSRGT